MMDGYIYPCRCRIFENIYICTWQFPGIHISRPDGSIGLNGIIKREENMQNMRNI